LYSFIVAIFIEHNDTLQSFKYEVSLVAVDYSLSLILTRYSTCVTSKITDLHSFK